MREWLLDRLGLVRKSELPDVHCAECDEFADCITQRAPGLGVDHWCEAHCPCCNPDDTLYE